MCASAGFDARANQVAQRLERIRSRIAEVAQRSGRSPEEVRILAVSKAHAVEAVRAAQAAGLEDFGENYVHEGIAKMDAADQAAAWHFIGRVQSNKTRLVAERYDWVQTVSRERIALRLADQRPADLPPLQVCIQVRMQEQDQRPALNPGLAPELVALIGAQPRLQLRGLMGLPLPDAPRSAYLRLRELFDRLNASGAGMDTLSMGMTADLELAVECGATMVRTGTGLFGPRN